MRIADLYAAGRPVLSFEFFPPKSEAGARNLYETIADLKRFDPGFVSVTWGAGGSSRDPTLELVEEIQNAIGILSMAHLTCIGAYPAELSAILDRLERAGLRNVLALRGDPPRQPLPDWDSSRGFRYAAELVSFVRTHGGFCVGGACYPETHPEAPNPETDLHHLVDKVACGAEFLISQLFFDNRDFFAFVRRARAAGIRVPIVPGIMPVSSAANATRMASLCRARIPEALGRALAACGEDPKRTLACGVAWATRQCRQLLAQGVPGLHFYTLNRSPATREVVQGLAAALA